VNGQNRRPRSHAPPPQDNYKIALEMARDKLRSCEFPERASAAGAAWNPSTGIIELSLLNRKFHLDTGKIDVIDPSGGKVELWEKIVLMHYLLKATGRKPTGKLISYKEIPDGRLYWPNFISRVHKHVLAAFGSNPESLIAAGSALGGRPFPQGDAAVQISALPRVNIIYIIWKSDEEFGPETGCPFDETITEYLPTEDITVLASMMAVKLMKIAREAKP